MAERLSSRLYVGRLFVGLLIVGACGACAVNEGEPSRPNIVLLIADDQDYEHLGFLGSQCAKTPELDRLASEGTVFPVAHVSTSRCRPSLATLLSGRLPHQNGIFFNEGEGARSLDPADTLPALLRSAGYATFLGGKFWEGDPHAYGFEAAFDDHAFVREGQAPLFDFIDQHAGKRPLFIWWAPLLPHWPHDPPARFVDAIAASSIPIPEWFASPAWKDVDIAGYREAERAFLATVSWFDEAVGALRAKLRDAGVERNTLFVYLIDNGSANGLVSKGSPFEKGLRTPLVFRWPDQIPAGTTRTTLASSVDVYATLLDYAGVEAPERPVGRSLRAAINGPSFAHREVLYGAVYPRQLRDDKDKPRANVYAIYARDHEWKYTLYLRRIDEAVSSAFRIKHDFAPALFRRRGDEDLFDLANDPHELVDVSGAPEHAERMRTLRAGALDWWESTGGEPLRVP